MRIAAFERPHEFGVVLVPGTLSGRPTMPFLFSDPAPTEIYTLSLHDALPIYSMRSCRRWPTTATRACSGGSCASSRSEEHTSELQSRQYLVCRLLLEKKKHDHSCPIRTPSTTLRSTGRHRPRDTAHVHHDAHT